MTGGLLGVFAHPDDEAYSLAGSMARLTDEGVDVTIVTFTRGEAGQIAEGSGATRENLGTVREGELRAACKIVGVTDVRIVGTADGGTEANDAGVAFIAGVMREVQPRVVVTMEPHGVTRHPDHIAVSKMTTDAFTLVRDGSAGAYPDRLYYSAVPKSALDALGAALEAKGLPQFADPNDPLAPRPAPDESIACMVSVASPWLDRKADALRAHATQMMEMIAWMPPDLVNMFLGTEPFQRPFPPAPDGEKPESDLFEAFRDDAGAIR